MALKVYGIGRLASEPKVEKTNSGISVLKVALAFNAGYGDFQRVDFVNCIFWKGSAEAVAKYCKKGDRLFVDGEIQTSQWEVDGGGKRYSTDVVVNTFEFIENRKKDDEQSQDNSSESPF